MTTTNLKEQLSNLVNLQTIDTEIYILRKEKDALPEEIKSLQAAFEAKKQHLAELEKNSLDLQKQRKNNELDLATKEESVKKLQGQLYSLKTNKEYSIMMQQIADAKADASVVEDKILGLFDKSEQIKSEVELERQRLKQEEESSIAEKNKITDRVKVIDDRLSQLEGKRKQAAPGIDSRILSQYDRILANREGLAIAKVLHDSCEGCNMHVPPQVINLIKMYDRIITCEICNRMLYIDNETA